MVRELFRHQRSINQQIVSCTGPLVTSWLQILSDRIMLKQFTQALV